MFKINENEIREYLLNQGPSTKVYIGCDSERVNVRGVWHADYTIAIVVHINGKNGCKLFGEVVRERDYDQKNSRPNVRLMTEVFKVSEMYLRLADVLCDRHVEIHLDLNPKEEYNSNAVIQQAIGFIRGTCNIIPMVKPKAWAASTAADRYKEVMHESNRALNLA
jgi:predicted RNase H-related nuclease YkuK (DUF458 family)